MKKLIFEILLSFKVTVEDAEEYCRILLHVEDDRSLCSAETRESGRGRVEA